MGSFKKKITIESVKTLEPGTILWDTDISGFGIRCQQKLKIYFIKYRFKGSQRWQKIGEHRSPWTPDMARKEAKRFLGELASGQDPCKEKRDTQRSFTMKEACTRFLEEHVESKSREKTKQDYKGCD